MADYKDEKKPKTLADLAQEAGLRAFGDALARFGDAAASASKSFEDLLPNLPLADWKDVTDTYVGSQPNRGLNGSNHHRFAGRGQVNRDDAGEALQMYSMYVTRNSSIIDPLENIEIDETLPPIMKAMQRKVNEALMGRMNSWGAEDSNNPHPSTIAFLVPEDETDLSARPICAMAGAGGLSIDSTEFFGRSYKRVRFFAGAGVWPDYGKLWTAAFDKGWLRSNPPPSKSDIMEWEGRVRELEKHPKDLQVVAFSIKSDTSKDQVKRFTEAIGADRWEFGTDGRRLLVLFVAREELKGRFLLSEQAVRDQAAQSYGWWPVEVSPGQKWEGPIPGLPDRYVELGSKNPLDFKPLLASMTDLTGLLKVNSSSWEKVIPDLGKNMLDRQRELMTLSELRLEMSDDLAEKDVGLLETARAQLSQAARSYIIDLR